MAGSKKNAPISYIEYLEMISDPNTTDEKILAYSIIERGETGFSFVLKPNPMLVEMTEFQQELENAMRAANWAARLRRETALKLSNLSSDKRPLLVSEGDSWWQFPVLIKDVIDHLGKDYLIASAGAAGDTAANMVFSDTGRGQTEYLSMLWRYRKHAAAFLFSAAGNDIIGEDVLAGDSVPVLRKILKKPKGNNPDVVDVIDMVELRKRLDELERAYRTVISNIRRLDSSDRPKKLPSFQKLPIIIHGYDYPFPHPWPESLGGVKDTRNPSYANKDQWLGSAFKYHGIKDPKLRRRVLTFLIDQLYAMLEDVAGQSQKTGVWVVNCRGTLKTVADWEDEIHGTSAGFAKISTKFRRRIKLAMQHASS